MRFRTKNKRKKNKKNKISFVDKIRVMKKIKYIKSEAERIAKSPEEVQKRMAVYYDEYNKQMPIAEEKLKEAKKLNHTENYNRILSFMNDMESVKKKMDRLLLDLKDSENFKEDIKTRIKKTRLATFVLVSREMVTISNKYKKENCDIENFEV